MQTLTAKLDLAGIEAASFAAGEPRWLRELRAAAFERGERLPVPNERMEGWRRTSLAGVDLTPVEPAPSGYAFVVSAEDAKRGVVACVLADAARSHPELVREALAHDLSALTIGKFAALAETAWTGGGFVYVPEGLELSAPIELVAEEGPYPRLVIVMGAGARGSISETHRFGGRLCTSVVDLIVRPGAQLVYAHVQECGPETVVFSQQRARVERDAKLITLNFGMGGRLAKSDVEVELFGPGAESDMLGLVFGERNQQFDYHTLQGHRARNTRSDLLYKVALDDSAHSIYTGVIVIENGAPGSEAYQANRNLLLSSGARADTQPKLEILVDDVSRCTHGATVGPVDDEQLFYLRSRGLDADAATRVIVEGFFQEVFEKAGDARLTAPLADMVAPHIHRLGAREG